MWGLIAAGLFKDNGLIFSGNANMLIWNSIGGGVIIVWHAVFGAITFFLLLKMGSFRISAILEQAGLDKLYHNEPAYNFTKQNGNIKISIILFSKSNYFCFYRKFKPKDLKEGMK